MLLSNVFYFKKYIPDRHFELLEIDTDSIYFIISEENLDNSVPPYLKPNYFINKLKWLTSEAFLEHEEAFIRCKIWSKVWDIQPDCSKFELFDKITISKMKVKYEEENQVAWF